MSEETIGADPAKVEVILNLTHAIDKQRARPLLGMVNYLGKFSKNLASIAEPIYAVIGKKAELTKKDLTQAPVLCLWFK